MDATLPEHIQGLLSPKAYPHAPKEVELRQTHISYVFLADELVYKLKKPLDLGFLDFTTLEKRRHFCEEEVRLNRRLCDGTYLGVVPVVATDAGVRVEADGEPIDFAVKMRRLPEDGMMPAILERNTLTSAQLRQLAAKIAEFHASSEQSETIDELGGFETAKTNWGENFDQTVAKIGVTISQEEFDGIRDFIDRQLKQSADVFDLRAREGRIRDCHGDMRSDAVCFVKDSVCIYDCIEFNERFRYSDVASDVAFLAMDLEFRGYQAMSDELLGAYIGATGDSTLALVLPFYKCYRAYVRGKVDGFQLDQPEIDDEQKRLVSEGARRYFGLAHQYATHSTPATLVVMTGLTGTGKSHLGNALAARLGAAIYSSDVVRKALLGLEATERRWEPFGAGIYNPETTAMTYDALLSNARSMLERGRPVVLDASFLKRDEREATQRLAAETNAAFAVVECTTDEATIKQRLDERATEEVASDGRWEIYQRQLEVREPIDELAAESHLKVDSATPLSAQIAAVLKQLG